MTTLSRQNIYNISQYCNKLVISGTLQLAVTTSKVEPEKMF